MLIRALVAVALLSAAATPSLSVRPASAASQNLADFTNADLMRATALDQIFSAFGETIAASAEAQGLPVSAKFQGIWKETAGEVFEATAMQRELAQSIDGKFTASELEELGRFFQSEFGQRITSIENAVQQLPADAQMAARDKGLALIEGTPSGSTRDEQFDEIMHLVSADIGRAMLGEAMRAMMVSMVVSRAQGDVEVPWDEIDAQLADILPNLELEVLTTQRAIMAYAYEPLSDSELEDYLVFLRTDPARKFYAVVSVSVGLVLKNTMSRFGEQLAHRLNQVNV